MTLKNEIDIVDTSKNNINKVINNTNVVLEKYGETGAKSLNEITEKIKLTESKMSKYAQINFNKLIKADYENQRVHVEIPLQIKFKPKSFCALFETTYLKGAHELSTFIPIGGGAQETMPNFTMQALAGTTVDILLKNLKIENNILKFDFETSLWNEYDSRKITLKTVTVIG